MHLVGFCYDHTHFVTALISTSIQRFGEVMHYSAIRPGSIVIRTYSTYICIPTQVYTYTHTFIHMYIPVCILII